MESYNPDNVRVSFGDLTYIVGESGASLNGEIMIKLPNIVPIDLSNYPKEHPDYAEDLVRVDIREVKDDKGNSYNVSFKLKKGSPYLEEILTLDPYDTTTIKAKTGE